MNNANQYGDLATQLLTESRRSTATNTLLKYNDVLVRSIIREQRDLEAAIEATTGAGHLTRDIGGTSSTDEVTQAIIDALADVEPTAEADAAYETV